MTAISYFAATQKGWQNIANDGIERQVATGLFDKSLKKARRKQGLFGNNKASRELPVIHASGVRQHPVEQIVPLDRIIGSENRVDMFDRDFLPLHEHMRERWIGVASARLQDIVLPSVELLCVDGQYYVRDGHHRISIALALGEKDIDAIVIEYI